VGLQDCWRRRHGSVPGVGAQGKETVHCPLSALLVAQAAQAPHVPKAPACTANLAYALGSP
jgi:hypothetical protein